MIFTLRCNIEPSHVVYSYAWLSNHLGFHPHVLKDYHLYWFLWYSFLIAHCDPPPKKKKIVKMSTLLVKRVNILLRKKFWWATDSVNSYSISKCEIFYSFFTNALGHFSKIESRGIFARLLFHFLRWLGCENQQAGTKPTIDYLGSKLEKIGNFWRGLRKYVYTIFHLYMVTLYHYKVCNNIAA